MRRAKGAMAEKQVPPELRGIKKNPRPSGEGRAGLVYAVFRLVPGEGLGCSEVIRMECIAIAYANRPDLGEGFIVAAVTCNLVHLKYLFAISNLSDKNKGR